MNILLAGNDVATRHLAEGMLGALGYDVAATVDGGDAWETWQREHQRVVVSDWTMPGLHGIEVCRRIRRTPALPYTYFILLTRGQAWEDHHAARDAGVDDFLSSPLDPGALRDRLDVAQRVLGLQGELAQLRALLDTCSCCHRVRAEGDRWLTVDAYAAIHQGTGVGRAICPSCYATLVEPRMRRIG